MFLIIPTLKKTKGLALQRRFSVPVMKWINV